MVQIDERLESIPEARDKKAVAADRNAVESALKICKKALVWVEPREPWLAMLSRLKAQEARRSGVPSVPAIPTSEHSALAPGTVASEQSPLACFQWGVLSLREQRLDRAVEWLRRAAQLQSNNHWYQYFLADLEDKAGSVDEALKDYSIALAHRPGLTVGTVQPRPALPVQRPVGDRSRRHEKRSPDAQGPTRSGQGSARVGLSLLRARRLYRARREYDSVIALGSSGAYGPAARLNRANIDAESGHVDLALREYDALLAEYYYDTSARFSRALLELRQGHAERALVDCNALLEMDKKLAESRRSAHDPRSRALDARTPGRSDRRRDKRAASPA